MEPDVAERLAEAMPWLDGPAEAIVSLTEPILGADAPAALKDALYGVWLGHPLHPAVVAMPIGCWTAAAIFDLTGEERAADLLVDLGLASAVLAALTGAAQYRDATSDTSVRRNGALHALLNTGAAALYVGSSMLRRQGNRTGAMTLSTIGLATTMASGWVGGELSYEMGIGVDRNAFETAPDEWVEVGEASLLEPGRPIRGIAGEMPVMIVQDDDGLHAIGATCSHFGGPLDEGKIENGCVECPWHGSVFRLDSGAVVHGPATSPQPRFETRIVNGRIEVRAARIEPLSMPTPSMPDTSSISMPDVDVPEAVQQVADSAVAAANKALNQFPGHNGDTIGG
jgi:nitrite reductase/ring-hydroxylating ferredoxin subunit/uncharacterized membrane protein